MKSPMLHRGFGRGFIRILLSYTLASYMLLENYLRFGNAPPFVFDNPILSFLFVFFVAVFVSFLDYFEKKRVRQKIELLI